MSLKGRRVNIGQAGDGAAARQMRYTRAMIRLLAALLSILIAPALALAQPIGAGTNNIAASLLAESEAPAPGGTVTIALLFEPRPGWHGYWLNPGDAGRPTDVQWQLPPGAQAGPLRYPVPRTLLIGGLMNYVFEGEHALLATLRLPPGTAAGDVVPLRARVDYLACTDQICVPERADLALDLRVGDGRVAPDQRVRFDRWRAALPRPLGSPASFERQGGRLRLAIPLPAGVAVADPYFFPATIGALDHSAAQSVSRNGDAIIVEAAEGRQAGQLAAMTGLLRIGQGQGLSFAAAPGAVPPAGDPIGAGAAAGQGRTILLALLGAVLGGLILNIMPCVFPILSLKALSLARAGGDERSARREAAAYSAGIILTCLLLGGLLLALRSGGAAIGWAFQLQEPRVVLLLLLLTTAIALNLAGLFRLPGLSVERTGGTTGAFATGALAAFIATPCTGPFMAAALGTALVLPGWAALAVFGGLGLGLALPFLLLGFVPALRRLLPKPGAWMERLQRLLSVPMFLTALALAWVLGRQTGTEGLIVGLAAALLLALALWWLGARAAAIPHRAGAAAMLVAAVLLPLALLPPTATAAAATSVLNAEPFTESRLAALRAEGRPVFVYFTADWCISCKVNERGAMASNAVAESFRARGTRVLVGDWTSGNAEIGRFLERHGRSGVPLYLYYPAGGEARVLPQILTSGTLTGLAG